MIKKLLMLVVVIVVIVLGVSFYQKSKAPATGFDPKNATYKIENESIVLTNGKAETEAAPGSAEKIKTEMFGEPTLGDLNNDGVEDAAVFIKQITGGTGVFYYVAAAIHAETGTVGTNAVFLGDRIAPQTLEIKDGQIIANYADRKPGEPMTATPSVGVSKYLMLDGTNLIEKKASSPVSEVGEHCGGNTANAATCELGAHCEPDPDKSLSFGDVGGTCVLN